VVLPSPEQIRRAGKIGGGRPIANLASYRKLIVQSWARGLGRKTSSFSKKHTWGNWHLAQRLAFRPLRQMIALHTHDAALLKEKRV
jgi:hypothetical protein